MPASTETSDLEAASDATAVAATKSNDASESSSSSSTDDYAAQESADAADSSASNADGNTDASAASAAKAAPALEDANSSTLISSANDFANLRNGGSYQLANDITVSDTVFVSANTSLDLNGHTIYYTGNSSLFHVQNNGTLTITDSQAATDNGTAVSGDVYGHEASVSYSNGKPTQLTYYVTESTPSTDGTSTTETLYQHTVTPRGVITATNGSGANSVIYMDGGMLNVQGGTICMPNSANHGSDCHIINVTGSSTFNLSGGYIAGGQRTTNYGGGVCLTNSSVLNMSGGVICANKGQSGAGVYAAQGTTVNVSNDAVISGNTVVSGSYGYSEKESAGYGGGIYAVGATVNVSGGYITNNRMEATSSVTHVGNLGGGGIAVVSTNSGAKNGSFSMSGGYVTGNYSN